MTAFFLSSPSITHVSLSAPQLSLPSRYRLSTLARLIITLQYRHQPNFMSHPPISL